MKKAISAIRAISAISAVILVVGGLFTEARRLLMDAGCICLFVSILMGFLQKYNR